MSKLLKKTIAVTTSVTTILTLSGVALFAPAFVFAATIVDGDTVTTADSFDIYIVKHIGDKKFKRLILNPTVFESYGHLTWDGVKTVTQAEQDVYTTSELVRAVDDPKVYKLTSEPNSDTGVKSWVNMTAAEFVAEGYDWDSIYEINATDRDNYAAGTDTVPVDTTPTPTGAGVAVSLASDSPAASVVAMGSQNVVFAKINFAGGENTTISAISVRRAGIANDADLSAVKLWDGSTQLGATQALNTTTHKAVFTGLSWVVPAGMTKVLTITGSIASTGTAATGTSPRLGIEAATDVTATTAVSGTFPAYGSAMSIAGLSVGQLNVDVRSVPGDNTPISGSTDQEISSWTFAVTSAEGMSVSKIKLTQVGTAANTDLSNIKLKINGAQIGSTVAALASDGTAIFDLASSPVAINAGNSKIIYVHADITAGITTSRTANFEITNAADVTAFGANSGGSVTITYSSGTTFVAQTGANAQTISQGTALTVTVNGATNPSIQTFIRGTTQNLVTALRFSAGAGEAQRVARLKLSLGGTGADATDISNVTLYTYDEATGVETQVGTPTAFVGTTATYGADSIGLDTGIFDVPESSNVVIHVRADVSAAAAWTGLGIFMNEARLDGVSSQGNIGVATDDNSDAIGNVSSHLAANYGTLTMSASPSTPSAQNVVPGTAGYVFGKFDFTMANEAAILSSVTVNLCEGAACTSANTPSGDASDVTNLRLWNGATQLGSTSALGGGTTAFSFNLTLPKNETVTLTVTADIPSTTISGSLWTSNILGAAIDLDVTATGVSSSATIDDPSADALGNAMTAAAETVTAAFQTVPASTIIVNQSQSVLSKVVLTAGAVGDVRVSSVAFTAASSTDIDAAAKVDAETDFGTLKLFDVTNGANDQIGIALSTFTDGGASAPDTATFTSLTVTIPKGTQRVLELRANVKAASSGSYFVGIDNLETATSDVVATGLSSNTTIYATGTADDDSGAIAVSSAGSMTVGVDAATPVAKFVAVGTAGVTGVDFGKFKFETTNEPVEMARLKVTLAQDNNDGNDNNDIPNFSALHLYNGATKVGSTAYPAGSNDAAVSEFTFVFDSDNDELIIPQDDSIVLTLKADMNGTSNGANSTTTPNFYIADVAATSAQGGTDFSASDLDARGVSSGARVAVTAATVAPSEANVNAMTIVRSKPVFALCTASNCTKASPSGALTPGTIEVIRFRITAEGDDVVFDRTNRTSNLRFTYAENGGANTATETADLYEVGKTAVIATQVGSLNLSTGSQIDFTTGLDTTISKGTYKEYYVKVDLADYATTGESFVMSIETASGDLSWYDGVENTITNTPSLDSLPLTGNTLVY